MPITPHPPPHRRCGARPMIYGVGPRLGAVLRNDARLRARARIPPTGPMPASEVGRKALIARVAPAGLPILERRPPPPHEHEPLEGERGQTGNDHREEVDPELDRRAA